MEGQQVHKDAVKIGIIIKWLSYSAMLISFIGFVLYMITNKGQVDYATFSTAYQFQPHAFLQSLLQLEPYAIMLLGILTLMITPFLRILLLTVSFYRNKNSLYTGIGILIICILILSAVLGKGH